MQSRALGVVAVTVAVAAAGCGGAKPLTKAEFTRRGEAICKQAGLAGPRVYTNIEGLLKKAAAVEQARITGISKLVPPGGLKASYERYKESVKARLALYQRYGHVTKAEAVPKAVSAQGQRLQVQEERSAAALGLRECLEFKPHDPAHRH